MAHGSRSKSNAARLGACGWVRPAVGALAAVAIVFGACGRQERAGDADSLPSYEHHAGVVFVDTEDPRPVVVSHEFSFHNGTSDKIAKLSIAQRSCGCTRCTIGNAEVAPGEDTRIRVSYDLRSQLERRRETVIITTGLEEYPRFAFTLSVDCYPRLGMVPEKPLVATVSPGGTELIRVGFVSYARDDEEERSPWVLQATRAGLSVDQGASREEDIADHVRKTEVQCTLRLACPGVEDPAFGTGDYEADVFVQRGAWALMRRVTWHALKVVDASPGQLFLQAGKGAAEEATVRLSAREAFRLEAIEFEKSYLKCDAPLGETRREHHVRVRLTAPETRSQATKSSIKLRTDHPRQPVVKIPVFILW
jgi:hypothetical protein